MKLEKKEKNLQSSNFNRVNDVISRLSSLSGCESSSRCSTASLTNRALLITPESSSKAGMQPLQESECSMDSGYQDHFGVTSSKKISAPILEDVKMKRKDELFSSTENILNFHNEKLENSKLVVTQLPLTSLGGSSVFQLTNIKDEIPKPIPKQRKSLRSSAKELEDFEVDSLDQRKIKLGISSIKDTKSCLEKTQVEDTSSNEVRVDDERSGSQQEVIRRRSMRMMTELQIYEIDDLGETQVVHPTQKKTFANKKLQKEDKKMRNLKALTSKSPPTILDDLGPKIVSQSWDIYRIGSPEDLRRPQALLPHTSLNEKMIENVTPHLKTLNKSSTYTRSTNGEVEASFLGASQMSAFSPVQSTSLFSINSFDQSDDRSFIRRTSLPPSSRKQQFYDEQIRPFLRNETKKENRIKNQRIYDHQIEHDFKDKKYQRSLRSDDDDYHILSNTNSLNVSKIFISFFVSFFYTLKNL